MIASQPPVWEEVGARERPSWYLDPLIAAQKRALHLELFRRWLPASSDCALKTDSFEEAFGEDALLPDLLSASRMWAGVDLSQATVTRAQARTGGAARFAAADVRRLPFKNGAFDLILSNSTLDHFDTRGEFEMAIAEIARVLRPGGRLLLTLDNPMNPLYLPLRWLTRTRFAPFPLGYTPGPETLRNILENAGLEVSATSQLIHNPRLVSTALFLALRRSLGVRAEASIRGLLRAFQFLEKLPTRRFTACFLAVLAVKREAGDKS